MWNKFGNLRFVLPSSRKSTFPVCSSAKWIQFYTSLIELRHTTRCCCKCYCFFTYFTFHTVPYFYFIPVLQANSNLETLFKPIYVILLFGFYAWAQLQILYTTLSFCRDCFELVLQMASVVGDYYIVLISGDLVKNERYSRLLGCNWISISVEQSRLSQFLLYFQHLHYFSRDASWKCIKIFLARFMEKYSEGSDHVYSLVMIVS